MIVRVSVCMSKCVYEEVCVRVSEGGRVDG